MPGFVQKSFLSCYLRFILWYKLLWFLFLSIYGIYFSEKLFKLVFNMQISRFNLIIYNFCKWSASSTLISHYAIIFSRALTYSSVVCLSSCINLTCSSIGSLYGFTLVTYDSTELGYLEGTDIFFTWSSGWIHTWYIWWYIGRIFRIIHWKICRRKFWGLVARWSACISCWTCNRF